MSAEQLTIQVTDAAGGPEQNAEVSFEQTTTSGITDSKGEVTLDLPTDRNSIMVTVTSSSGTVQAPFYITEGGSRRMTVNVPYLQQQILDQTPQSTQPVSAPPLPLPLILGVVVLIAVAVAVGFLAYKYRDIALARYRKYAKKRKESTTIPDMSEYFRDHSSD